MAQPNVAGAVLALVSEAVGVQALRHTYQIVHTALQSELPPPPRHARHGAAGRCGGGGGGWHTATGLPHGSHGHGSGGAAQGAAGPTATANGAGSGNGGRGRPARPLGRNGSASDRAAAAAAAEPEAPLAVLLPVETSTRAFEGMPDAPAPQLQEEAAAASAAPVAAAPAGAGAAPPPSGHLCMPLSQRWAGNAVLVKLIAPEDRTGEFGDDKGTLKLNAQWLVHPWSDGREPCFFV